MRLHARGGCEVSDHSLLLETRGSTVAPPRPSSVARTDATEQPVEVRDDRPYDP